ncbi:MAG: hypothetical protein RET84_02535 [Pseudomonadota bacterium]|nr:hypothetical protein [Pseudomonadota bacterium]
MQQSIFELGMGPEHSASPSPDTSLLFEELRLRYQVEGRPIRVSFRNLVAWLQPSSQQTHFIHPYPAKLLPHIAHFFTRASVLTRHASAILDPFAGSGTVALEGSLSGLKPLVCDANPLALLISKVKTTPYDVNELILVAADLSHRIGRLRSAPAVSVINEALWYLPATKSSLEKICRGISEIEDIDVRDFFRVCFSAAARKLSLADPSISVPVRIRTKSKFSDAVNARIARHLEWLATASPELEFERIVQTNIARVAATNRIRPNRQSCELVGKDARCLVEPGGRPLSDNSISLTVTSPPYGSAQKYVRASSLSLNWLSLCTPDGLSSLESKSIGREHLTKHSAPAAALPPRTPVERSLKKIRAISESRAEITATYLSELLDAITEIERVTAVDGRVVFVIGNNTVAGQEVANDNFICSAMENMGLALELVLQDRIHSRGLLTARNKTAGVISSETILVFKKSKS